MTSAKFPAEAGNEQERGESDLWLEGIATENGVYGVTVWDQSCLPLLGIVQHPDCSLDNHLHGIRMKLPCLKKGTSWISRYLNECESL